VLASNPTQAINETNALFSRLNHASSLAIYPCSLVDRCQLIIIWLAVLNAERDFATHLPDASQLTSRLYNRLAEQNGKRKLQGPSSKQD
jgi:hypothetical protein